MIEWKVGDEAIWRYSDQERRICLTRRHETQSNHWHATRPGKFGEDEFYSEKNLYRPAPIREPVIAPPDPGIKRDFEPGGLTGEVKSQDIRQRIILALELDPGPQAPARPSMLTVLEGVTRWAWEGHANRDTTVKVGGDEVVVRVVSRPTYASFTVRFRRPETVEGTMDTLDHALMEASRHPNSSATITFGEEIQ